jgi:hypothetical protein
MGRGRLAALAAVCGTAVLAGLAGVGHFASPSIDTAVVPIENSQAPAAASVLQPLEQPQANAAVPVVEPAEPVQAAAAGSPDPIDVPQDVAAGDAHPSVSVPAETLSNAPSAPQAEEPRMQLAYANTPDTVSSEVKPDAPQTEARPAAPDTDATETASPAAIVDECALMDSCIDQYLFALYQRAPKVDSITVSERVKVTVTKKGKTKTITKTVSKLVDEDFSWKDPKAADKVSMPLMDYVIGGMDRSFKRKLYRALRAADEAGLVPGITSGFRDDYRQGIASGKKAASDSSYHGGSRRGGYGHGMAADLVSVRGDTRAQRCLSSEVLWKWIDAHGQEYGVGRPYLDRDPPHVGPIDGKEYADKRGLNRSRVAAQTKEHGKNKLAARAKVQRVAKQADKPAAASAEQSKAQPAAPAAAQQANKPRLASVSGEQSKAKPANQRVMTPTAKPRVAAVTKQQNQPSPAAHNKVQRVAPQPSKPHVPAVSSEQSKPQAPANVQRVALQSSKPHLVTVRAEQNKTKRAKVESKPNSI